MYRTGIALVLAVLMAVPCVMAEKAGVVCNVKVLSDKVEDVSSVEAWQQAVIKDGMSNQEKALKAWEAVVKFRHHDSDPQENLFGNPACHDAIKMFNSYGYCSGGGAQVFMLQMARALGFNTRHWSIHAWGAPDVYYDDAWHYLDPGMICYYLKPDGKIAGVEEIVENVNAWFKEHPDHLGKVDKIKQFLKEEGYAKGPELLRNCPTLDARGNYTLNFFGWYSAMYIFGEVTRKHFLWEQAYTQGHRMNIQLRRGERLIRNWSNQGQHINQPKGRKPDCIGLKVGTGALYYTPKLGDLANGRVGSGSLEYTVPMTRELERAALSHANLAFGKGVTAKKGNKAAVFELERTCGYVFLDGSIEGDAAVGRAGEIKMELSDTNGVLWKEVGVIKAGGPIKLDLTELVKARYQYRLKFSLSGKGTVLKALKIVNAVQVSQRALPTLGQGENTISADLGAAEGTVTVEGAGPKQAGKQPQWADFGVKFENTNPDSMNKWGTIAPSTGQCNITVPVTAPGDIKRLRFGCNYRAGLKTEGWDLQVSFDKGRTFKTVGQANGPFRQNGKFIVFEDIPKGIREAQVRFAARNRGSLIIFAFRVDADYAMPNGGKAPVKVIYRWKENGGDKEHAQVVGAKGASYKINCAAKPEMVSIVLERAD